MRQSTYSREFMQRSGEAAAGTTVLATLPKVHAASSEKQAAVRLGITGWGGEIRGHLRWMVERQSAVSFAWHCDVDPQPLNGTAKTIDGFQASPA